MWQPRGAVCVCVKVRLCWIFMTDSVGYLIDGVCVYVCVWQSDGALWSDCMVCVWQSGHVCCATVFLGSAPSDDHITTYNYFLGFVVSVRKGNGEEDGLVLVLLLLLSPSWWFLGVLPIQCSVLWWHLFMVTQSQGSNPSLPHAEHELCLCRYLSSGNKCLIPYIFTGNLYSGVLIGFIMFVLEPLKPCLGGLGTAPPILGQPGLQVRTKIEGH